MSDTGEIECPRCGGHGEMIVFQDDEARSGRWVLPLPLRSFLREGLTYTTKPCERCEGSGMVEPDLLNPRDFQKLASQTPLLDHGDPNYHGWVVLLLDTMTEIPDRRAKVWRKQLVALLDGFAEEIQLEGLEDCHRYGTFASALLYEDDDGDDDDDEAEPVEPKDGEEVVG